MSNQLLNKGETRQGNVIMSGNVPVATVVAGRRIPLKAPRAAKADETVVSQEVISAGDKTYLAQHLSVGEAAIFRMSSIFIKTDKAGMPLATVDAYKSDKGLAYKTATVDGTVVGLRTIHEGAFDDRQAFISGFQRLT